MKKDLTIKKEYRIKLKQIKEGLSQSNSSPGWNSKVDNGINSLENALSCNEQLFLSIGKEDKSILSAK